MATIQAAACETAGPRSHASLDTTNIYADIDAESEANALAKCNISAFVPADFSKVYKHAISNMKVPHRSGPRHSGPAVDLRFHPVELGSQPISQFHRLQLLEETVRLADHFLA